LVESVSACESRGHSLSTAIVESFVLNEVEWVDDIFGYNWGAYAPRVSRLAPSPNILCGSMWRLLTCRRPARIRCENYGKIILQCSVHRFNYERYQTLADVGCSHSSDIILMICDDGLNCGNFLLGSHAGTFNFLFSVGNHEWREIS
jgi:hypothetical protein